MSGYNYFPQMCFPEKLTPQFVAAKTFIPALASTPGATYTFINGPSGKDFVMRKFGNVCIGNRAQSRMCDVLMDEYRDKEIRINEVRVHILLAIDIMVFIHIRERVVLIYVY